MKFLEELYTVHLLNSKYLRRSACIFFKYIPVFSEHCFAIEFNKSLFAKIKTPVEYYWEDNNLR